MFKRAIWLSFIAAVGLAVSLGGCGKGEEQGGGMRRGPGMGGGDGSVTAGIPVEAVSVTRDTISTFLLTTTTLDPQRAVDVIAKTSGLVSKLLVEEGDRVRAGQTLAQLDEEELLIALHEAEIRAQNMKRINDRNSEMFEKNLVSKQVFDDAKFNYETAQSQLENAKLQVEHTRIKSPIDGVVTERLIEVGQRVNQNQVLFRCGDFDPLLARIFIPEKEIRKVHAGQGAEVSVEAAPDRKFRAVVSMISPVVDPASGTVKVTLEIHDKSGILRPGMFANVHIITDTHADAVVMPKKALVLESERDEVFVVEDGTARKAQVNLGFSDGERVEVLDGLSVGQMVVTVGQEGLRDGIPVRVVGQSPLLSELGGARPGQAGDTQVADTGGAATPAGRREAGRPAQGDRRAGFQMTPERLQRIEQYMLQNPEIRKEFERRSKEDPEFATSTEKKMQFFREMREKLGMGRPGSN